ncbi:MAG: ribonuclease P protein component [Candidatus Magasanikbacteria bacterium CG_4_9_14_0_2_um_filter_42_11]|uniref:Ribonuclease P protein component n=1 Tax=Candidatus Magasanikbacteria bacterium CG_4_9_14_0_2_um_filter_42_11 TaxID=1974643 RepID=A0A2M8FAB3_9BACT|nr:MAG: ribonuclease P protein component [Candidatus Magasanikbacteria bacterium CG10_big_fil_rev_8_21_14_0_10_43_9]PIY92071.1 MAG: ribonuclease P protein component [Candidatus Magasanikbacteria bacterium CG_4_10_14_0_8_um_filter_42_12]PJC52661.1 MAG: ribonuclease P protein component [Candidatus Magasanikbacteria bacterium CG_4_9_14_0_2_um_filter_42_11]
MLKPQNRLRKMKDIEILFKEGRFVGGDLVTLKLWWIDPDKYPRREYSKNDLKFGFVVGKKVSKSAVKRNRVKRQMREVIRLLLKDAKIKDGAMVSVIAKPSSLGASYEDIEKSIVDVLRKGRLLQNT